MRRNRFSVVSFAIRLRTSLHLGALWVMATTPTGTVLGAPGLNHVNVFTSGQDGYFGYRMRDNYRFITFTRLDLSWLEQKKD